jgi:hypothetical protein
MLLIGTGGLTLQALAAQRLSRWDKDGARQALRGAAERAENPLHRRVFALASLQAGESRARIRVLLREFEENSLTLAMLEDTNFRRPKPKPDFEGD